MFPARKLLLFALLSFTDFGLTWHLLRAGGGTVYESNPVAAWWLGRFGWLGLAGFKGAMMGLAGGLAVLIFLRRPRTGDRVLAFGCAALVAVVLYSAYLCDSVRRRADLDPVEEAQLGETAQRLEAASQRGATYRAVLRVVLGDVRGRRCTLEEAVARLAATEQAQDPAWVRHFHVIYPGRGDAECLALSVINHVEQVPADTPAARQFRGDLRAQFRALYGRDLPAGSISARDPVAPAGQHLFADRTRME